ncbi:MAG: hypothetical protein DI535_14305 [Citrobacter freundii]|nr:MAG: hypothetical protein DI535_14305 [Citrobacter freundii]
MQTETVRPLPLFYIGKTATNQRITKFLTEKHGILSTALGRSDTKSIWYSREHFARLLEEIDLAGGDGICVSFGVYEDGHEYAGQLCLLFNSTRESTFGAYISHTNVVLEDEPDYPERSALPRDIFIFPGDNPTEQDIRDFNFGHPCPPRCPDGGDGGEG